MLEFAAAELRISPRLGTMERIVTLPRLGQLQVADSPRLDEWLGGRDRIEGWAHRLEKLRGAALGAALVTVAGVVVFFQFGLPWMAEQVAPLVPRAMERAVGAQAMDLLDAVHLAPSRLSTARRKELDLRFRAMVAGLPREHDYQLAFRHAPSLGPNAFALPDGSIILTDELVNLANDDDAVLGVLAHEIGHVEREHALRRLYRAAGIAALIMMIGGDIGSGAEDVLVQGSALLSLSYSRDQENEADRVSVELMSRAGKDPESIARFLEKIRDIAGDGPDFMSTHPGTEGRIEAVRRYARELAGD